MKQYTDKCLCSNDWVIEKIQNENARQLMKWGIQIYSAFEWLTYIAEEMGSLAKAIGEHEYRGGPKDKIISEAIQVATLALKVAEIFDVATGEEGTVIQILTEKFCPDCEGTGQIEYDAGGGNSYKLTCGRCGGKGKIQGEDG